MVQRMNQSPIDGELYDSKDGMYCYYSDYAALEDIYNKAVSDVVNEHLKVVALEKRCKELEREMDELTAWASRLLGIG